MKNTIAVDFDGVIHNYSRGWADGSIYDPPVPGAFDALRTLMAMDYAVFIFSARDPNSIAKWIVATSGMPIVIIPDDAKFWNRTDILGVTNRKLPADVYIDDRCLEFKGDWRSTIAGTLLRTGRIDDMRDFVNGLTQ